MALLHLYFGGAGYSEGWRDEVTQIRQRAIAVDCVVRLALGEKIPLCCVLHCYAPGLVLPLLSSLELGMLLRDSISGSITEATEKTESRAIAWLKNPYLER